MFSQACQRANCFHKIRHLNKSALVSEQGQRLLTKEENTSDVSITVLPGYSSSGVITDPTSWGWENLGFHVQLHWSYK